jgi:hypothetical protein
MFYSYVEIEYVATSFSPARTDLAVKLLRQSVDAILVIGSPYVLGFMVAIWFYVGISK